MSQNVKCKGLVITDLYFFPVQVEIRTNLPIIPEVLHSVLSIYFEYSKKKDFSDSHMQKLCSHACCSSYSGCVSYCCDMGSKLLQKSVLGALEETHSNPTEPTNRCPSTTAASGVCVL